MNELIPGVIGGGEVDAHAARFVPCPITADEGDLVIEAAFPKECSRVGSFRTDADAERGNGLLPGDSALPTEEAPSELFKGCGGDGAMRCFLVLRAGLSVMVCRLPNGRRKEREELLCTVSRCVPTSERKKRTCASRSYDRKFLPGTVQLTR